MTKRAERSRRRDERVMGKARFSLWLPDELMNVLTRQQKATGKGRACGSAHAMQARSIMRGRMQVLHRGPRLHSGDVQRIARREAPPDHPLAQPVEIPQMPADLGTETLSLFGLEICGVQRAMVADVAGAAIVTPRICLVNNNRAIIAPTRSAGLRAWECLVRAPSRRLKLIAPLIPRNAMMFDRERPKELSLPERPRRIVFLVDTRVGLWSVCYRSARRC